MLTAPLPRRLTVAILSLIGTTAVIGTAIAPAPSIASGIYHRATLAAPVEKQRYILRGTVWFCEGTACVAGKTRSRPANTCARLARKVGTVTVFTTRDEPLDADGLAHCNRD